ncbi:MAG: FkbM family methyltransferase [Anaerolineales bacterium]|nr:FkbM family methyltransferase [Anaerolineales bacterium]MCX7607732.1 FkbM family methyltransferase [Anaerolineales bacterium]MDW8226305.1 FkbM family methyltransferase [Anaerolineales bacterium]
MRTLLLDAAALAARVLPLSVKRALYRFPFLARLIRQTLNRVAPIGLTEVKIAAGELAGLTLLLDLQSEKDYWLGVYEPELQEAVRTLIAPGWVVYDVGANIGYVSLLLAKMVGERGRVFAFEALPANVERLRRNLALNGMQTKVEVVAGAVTQGRGPVRFFVHASGGMGKVEGSAGRTERYQAEVVVDGLSLDEFVYEQGHPSPQAIKMDIEGGEVLALPGMRRLLAEARPLLLLELHGPEATRLAWELLSAANYEICQMCRGFPRLLSPEALDWKAYLVAKPLPTHK